MKRLSLLICIVVIALSTSVSAGPVVVFDRITTVGQPVYLKALTKGKFFPEGGVRVACYLDGKLFGKNMSGGDGYAYLKYTPEIAGLKSIEVRSKAGSGTGSILVLDKNERILGIEVIGGLRESILSPDPMPGCLSALTMIKKKYQIVYFAKPLTAGYLKKWLKEKGFPKSVVLGWTGVGLMQKMSDRGIDFHAMVGSSDWLSGLSEYAEHRFTFEDTEAATVAEDWNEIVKLLKQSN